MLARVNEMVQTRRTTLLQLTAAPTLAHADATATVSANGVNATETTSTGAALTVWNSLSWERKEWLKVEHVTGACTTNRTCAQQYVCKYQSCMVISGRLIVHAPVEELCARIDWT